MQHFPPDRDTERRLQRRTRGAEPPTESVQHREDDAMDAATDWLAHIAAGRIPVR
jgi:hypothetical protein